MSEGSGLTLLFLRHNNNSQTRKLANSQTRKLANSQTRKLANSQTRKLAGLRKLLSCIWPRPLRHALAVLLLASIGTIATPTFAVKLVSNISVGGTGGAAVLSLYDIAQRFTTGSNAGGYTLTNIQLAIVTNSFTGTTTPTVKVFSGSATGTEVATLSGPANLNASTTTNSKTYTFTASGTVTLNKDTNYWVVVEGGSSWPVTVNSDDEDDDSASGWSIRNVYEVREASSTGSFSDEDTGLPSMALQVNGTIDADTTAPTFSSATVNGTSLVITFSEELAAAANLANNSFTVEKTPSSTNTEQTETLSGSPSIDGTTVTLTLSSAVVSTDTSVKVTYTKPTTASGSNDKLKDASDNYVATFTDQAVTNNTPRNLVFTPTSLAVTEGSTDTYNVKLGAQPTGNVTVTIASDDTSAVTVSPTSLDFTTGNWETAQPVTVTGELDTDANNETVTLTHSGSGVHTKTLTVTTTDDNSRFIPVIIPPHSFRVDENQVNVATLTASVNGVPSPPGLTWSITGGNDTSHFSLTSGGVLSFNSPKNFERPDDSDPMEPMNSQ